MSAEPTGFLYPFLAAEERNRATLLADLAQSAAAKMRESEALRARSIEHNAQTIEQAAAAMADRFAHGARLFAFGNGGSATDAQGSVQLFRTPPHGRALPALSLVDESAVLTALANDVGFDLVFSRQLIAHAEPGDIAVGFSTSGDSVNVLRGLEEGWRRGLLTVGLCGYEGSAMARSEAVTHCLVVRSESVHRTQEAQAALTLQLWSVVQRSLDERVIR
jgi:D-sedoheptulose 7-phosphate isomerase